MLDLGLDAAGRRAFENALISSTSYTIRARLLDRGRQEVAQIPVVLDGERTIDTTADVITSATATVWDKSRRLLQRSNAIFLDRILQVTFLLRVPQLGQVVKCPLFTGPCSAPEIQGDTLTIEAQGLELWAMGDVRKARHYPKGSLVTEVIRDLMLTGVIEKPKWLSIPRRRDRLPAPFTVALDDKWWPACLYLADSIDCDLFYNAAGYCILRARPSRVVEVFTGRHLLAIPKLHALIGAEAGSDVTSVRNRYVVVGQAKPEKQPAGGSSTPPADPPAVIGIWNVPKGNRYAAASLGHEDASLWLKDVYQNDHIRLEATADRMARNRGKRGLQLAEQAEISTSILPHIEAYDRFKVRLPDTPPGPFEHLQSGTPWFPTADNPQTWGSTRRVSG